MKIDRSEVAPSGKARLAAYLGDEELDIIRELCDTALKHTPRTADTEQTIARMAGMRRAIDAFYKQDGRVEFKGEKLCITHAGQKACINRSSIRRRLKRGWTMHDALHTPRTKGPKKKGEL